jgi:hypothetical protein
MSNSGSLGTATAEPATMNRVSLGHEEIMDSKNEKTGRAVQNHELGTGFLVHMRIISAVKRVEFVSDRM